MKRLIIQLLVPVLSLTMATAQDKTLFFSEYIANGYTSALEIYNPTADTVELKTYSIIRNGAYRFDFPGGVILPFSTWVGCRNEPANPPDPAVLAVADTSWPAMGSIWYFSNTALIQLLRDSLVIDAINGDPRNAEVAGVANALTTHTMIRKPSIFKGETIWDVSRGTNAGNSQWIVNEVSYTNLGAHTIDLGGVPWLSVKYAGNSLNSGKSLVDYGTIEINQSYVKDFVLENNDNTNNHLFRIESSDNLFSLSDTNFNIGPGGTDTLHITFSPAEELQRTSIIQITGIDDIDSLFTFSVKGAGTAFNIQDTMRYYVSPTGLDTNSGKTPGEALKTIQAALNKVIALNRPSQPQIAAVPAPSTNPILGTPDNYREIILANETNLTYRVEIHLLPGWHFLNSRITINNTIGGNVHFIGDWADGAGADIKAGLESNSTDPEWMDLPVEKMPVVSGGRLVTGWRDTTVNGVSAWVADLPDVKSGSWYFKQLFVNGKRAIRSRFPKTGTYRITEILPTSTGVVTKLTDRVRVRTSDISNWKNLTDVEMVHLHRWVDERMPVKSVDIPSAIATLKFTPSYDMDGSHPVHGAGLSAYFWDHVFETMSEPGEWYLDRPSGKLFYIPKSGENKENTEIIAPSLLNLFRILGSGSTNQYIWNVSFEKIGFMHTESSIEAHKGSGNNATYGEGALSYEDARIPRVIACYFGHLGDLAVEFESGTMGGEISCNVFRDLGSGATAAYQTTTSSPYKRTGYHCLHDNDIMGYGLFYFGEVAMRHFNVVHMVIEHNHIRDGYFNGITCNATTSVAASFGYMNAIRQNKIHDLVHGELSDMGAIYTSGYQPYSSIVNNLLYNIDGRDYGGSALYIDDNTAHFNVRNNILFNSNEDVLEEKSHYNLIENNIIAFGARSSFYSLESSLAIAEDVLGLGIKPTEFNRNIVLQNGGRSFFKGPDTSPAILLQHKGDYNLFWDYSLSDVEMNEGQSFAQWKAASGDDPHSLVADPVFVDPLNGDFRFAGHSPAQDLGFVEIDMSGVGPRKSEWLNAGAVWIDYPSKPVKPDFLPSDLPGLQMWITAKDLTGDKVSKWEDRTPNKFSSFQFDESLKPTVKQGGLNGFPVVHFDGTTWMSSEHKSLEVSGNLGVFRSRDFSILLVNRSAGDQSVVFSKAEQSIAGGWSIGELQNKFRWETAGFAGIEGDDFTIRAFRRTGNSLQCIVNGQIDSSATKAISTNFSNSWSQYYLGKLGGSTAFNLNGDLAEMLIYRGSLSDEELLKLTQYLRSEWGIQAGPVPVNDPEPGRLMAYPNPADDFINIKGIAEFNELIIFDSSGTEVNKFILNGVQSINIPINNLSPGLYLISAGNEKGRNISLRFIKK